MSLCRSLAAGVCLFASFLAVGSVVTAQDKSIGSIQTGSRHSVEQLLVQLESDVYLERQRASRDLAGAGVGAIQPLVERLLNGPPESAARCSRLLSRIAMSAGEHDMTRIARILMLLSDNGFEHLRDESIFLKAKWKQARIERTVQRLNEAGIQTRPLEGYAYNSGIIRGGFDNPFAQIKPVNAVAEPNTVPARTLPVLSTNELLANVNAIISATEAENNESYSAEILSQSESNSATGENVTIVQSRLGTEFVVIGGEARLFVGGDGGFITVGGDRVGTSIAATPYEVTIDERFDGSTEQLAMLRMLPGIAQLTIADRAIDADLLDLLKSNEGINYVTLKNCTYDLASVLALMNNRPQMTLTATGHDAFLGVQLQTSQLSGGTQVCLVLEVVADTAAEQAGCKNADIIQTINGFAVSTYEQVILAIGSCKPGDKIMLGILRDDTEQVEIQAILRSRDAGE